MGAEILKRNGAKVVSAKQALSKIRNGSRVFIGSGCGEPQHLIHTMVSDPSIRDIMVYQMLAFTFERYLNDESFLNRFNLKLFFVTNSMRQAAYDGKIDYIPAYLSEIPHFFWSNQISLDTALIQISPPDRFGLASLGVSVDVTRQAARSAKMVIAQVNASMPRTHGDSFIHIDDIDYLVPRDEELLEHVPEVADETAARRIARYVSELIDASKRNRYIFSDQLPPPAEDLIFIEDYKSRLQLINGQTMYVRPFRQRCRLNHFRLTFTIMCRNSYSMGCARAEEVH